MRGKDIVFYAVVVKSSNHVGVAASLLELTDLDIAYVSSDHRATANELIRLRDGKALDSNDELVDQCLKELEWPLTKPDLVVC